jgi:phosphoglycolate phosphatase-like HAD superfamily hydrolase
LQEIYRHPGPFVTVWLDGTRATESGAHEVALRWEDVRGRLAEDVKPELFERIWAAVDADRTPGRHGLLIVAAADEVVLAEPLRDTPATSTASVAPLPQLMPYLADRSQDLPHVVVVADRTGADILTVSATGVTEAHTVAGSAEYPVHRTGRDDWSERHFQLRVENSWEANAKGVAEAVRRYVAQMSARLVVVAGDVRARQMIADDLGTNHGFAVRTVEEGGRAAGSSADALQRAVRDQVLRQIWHERREILEHLAQNLGRKEYAAAGVKPVIEALRAAQADTVVLSDDPSSTLTAWVGPQATQFGLEEAEAEAFGVREVQHDRFDSALARAIVGTGATLLVTPGAHGYLDGGIGALLRFDPAARSDSEP